MPNPKINRIFFDLETSPNLVLAFRTGYDLVVNHDAIVKERKIICVGWKREGENRVKVIRWDKNQDDKQLLIEFSKVLEEADEIVGHFIDKFDWPWVKTRCLIHRLPPLPNIKTIDTKAWASRGFYFNSNKLDYLADILGHGKKIKTDFDLWKDIVIHNCPKALNRMCLYCARDVEVLEKVYLDLAAHIKPKTHAGVLSGGEKWSCPRTGSKNVRKDKTRVSASGTITHQMKETTTGTYYTISDSAYKKYQKWLAQN